MIRKLEVYDAALSAQIHLDALSNDFLPSFGKGFLKILHKQLIVSDMTITLGDFTNKELRGIIIGTYDTSKVLKSVFLKSFIYFVPYIILKIIIRPKTIKYLLETIFFSKKNDDEVSSELLLLTIATKSMRSGIGTKLLQKLIKEFRRQKIEIFKVGTLDSLKGANAFYKKNGAHLQYKTKMYDKIWNVYYFKLNPHE